MAHHVRSASAVLVYDGGARTPPSQARVRSSAASNAYKGQELADPAAAPESITYDVLTLDGDSLIVTVDVGNGCWTFRLARYPVSPLAGKWKLAGEGALVVGPTAGDVCWWSSTADDVVTLARLLAYIFQLGAYGPLRH